MYDCLIEKSPCDDSLISDNGLLLLCFRGFDKNASLLPRPTYLHQGPYTLTKPSASDAKEVYRERQQSGSLAYSHSLQWRVRCPRSTYFYQFAIGIHSRNLEIVSVKTTRQDRRYPYYTCGSMKPNELKNCSNM